MDENAANNALCGEGGSGGGLRQHLDALANLDTGKTSKVWYEKYCKIPDRSDKKITFIHFMLSIKALKTSCGPHQ